MDRQKLLKVAQRHGTPVYVYDGGYLEARAKQLLGICRQADCLLRYAVKANHHPGIIGLFDKLGLGFDASSEFEAQRLIDNGVQASKISLSSQQLPGNLSALLRSGVRFTATSFHQLEAVQKTGWKGDIGVRLNPGIGAGHNNRTKTGGAASSFGIWHEYIPEILKWQEQSATRIKKLHVHVGSGGDPAAWGQTINRCLELAELFEAVDTLNMGGGYKVARMPAEQEADMSEILKIFATSLDGFKSKTGRKLSLEIEPGAWLVAGGGFLLARITDTADTGPGGFNFLKLDTGMNDFLRSAMYGSQHPIEVLNQSNSQKDYVVVGHNCETGDILTPAEGDPEAISPRRLNQASIGDLVSIGSAGAYSASMRAIGYNDFPSAKEVFL